MNTSARLLEHLRAYPALQVEDIFKYLFQSAFGCEHLITNPDAALAYVKAEARRVPLQALPQTDRLDGGYSRAHLSWLGGGLHPETLTRLFCLSAKTEEEGARALQEKLAVARALVHSGEIPLDSAEFDRKEATWAEMGYPAIHHSEAFRQAYAPAYRVISNRYAEFLPLLARIDSGLENGPVVLAIEGGSANGKTTLADILQEVYDCNVFHTDDFFLRPEQRTPERLAETGGNLDRERFLSEVVRPLTVGETVCYRPFRCMTQTLGDPITVPPKRLTVVEGAYSLHPAFGRYYDLALFMDIPSEVQRERILRRNSHDFAKRFFDEWIPMENAYFNSMGIRESADLIHTPF